MKSKLGKALIFFLKYPELGRIKTRLARDIGDEATQNLCICFIKDILDKFSSLDCDIFVFLTPPEKISPMKKMVHNRYPIYPQEGKDLGERMQNSFEKILACTYKKALIMGSDIPDFPLSVINKGFSGLDIYDAVIGPTYDGGYYLLGFQKEHFLSGIFKNIQWSTEAVFKQTMDIFKKNAFGVKVLPKWWDIDSVDDLIPLMERNADTDFRFSKTMTFLKTNSQILKSKDPSK